MKKIKLVLDNDVLDKYNIYYFENHPRARKIPIEHPYHPSINIWCILPRMQMNALKQKWKDFGVWWISELGYTDMKIDKCEMIFDVYHPTKRRTDPDNFSPKFLDDSFVESGFLVDDDRDHVESLTIRCHVDKEHPRTEITVNILES